MCKSKSHALKIKITTMRNRKGFEMIKMLRKKKVVKLHCWIKPSASRPSEMYRANERHKPSSKSTKIAQEASTFWSDHLDNKHTYFPLINNLGARFTKQGYQSLSLDLG